MSGLLVWNLLGVLSPLVLLVLTVVIWRRVTRTRSRHEDSTEPTPAERQD